MVYAGGGGVYSDLDWTGVFRSSPETLTHV